MDYTKVGRLLTILLLVVILSLSIVPSIASALTTNNGPVRVIIALKNIPPERVSEVCKGCKVYTSIPELNVVVVEAPRSYLMHLAKHPAVRYIEEDRIVKINDEVQWNIKMIYAPDVWSTYSSTYGAAAYGYYSTIRVAVVDTGIDYTHTELQGAVTYCIVSLNNGATFYKGTNLSKCSDPNGHGTHVAGIIAARLNGVGVAGVAPRVLLYAVRVLSASGSGYISDIAKGIIEATKGPDGVAGTSDDADVISMSLGGPSSTTLYNAVQYAYSYGVVLVAANGNEGASSPSCPACYPEVIAVGAVDANYNVPSWSNRNPDVVAPGVNILSTLPSNKLGYMSGTSMACPHVSGVVALIQSLRLAAGLRKLTPSEVINVVLSTAIDLGPQGYDELYGYGLVDAYAAVYTALRI